MQQYGERVCWTLCAVLCVYALAMCTAVWHGYAGAGACSRWTRAYSGASDTVQACLFLFAFCSVCPEMPDGELFLHSCGALWLSDARRAGLQEDQA